MPGQPVDNGDLTSLREFGPVVRAEWAKKRSGWKFGSEKELSGRLDARYNWYAVEELFHAVARCSVVFGPMSSYRMYPQPLPLLGCRILPYVPSLISSYNAPTILQCPLPICFSVYDYCDHPESYPYTEQTMLSSPIPYLLVFFFLLLYLAICFYWAGVFVFSSLLLAPCFLYIGADKIT